MADRSRCCPLQCPAGRSEAHCRTQPSQQDRTAGRQDDRPDESAAKWPRGQGCPGWNGSGALSGESENDRADQTSEHQQRAGQTGSPSSNQSRGTSAYICGKTPSATGRSVDQARMGDDHEYHVASPQVEAGHDRAQGQHDTQDMPQVPSPQAERNEGSQRE
jgi:hypothetical protein